MQNFERMAFLAAVKEAKLRQFVTPGQPLIIAAQIVHEGSGFTVTDAQGSHRRQDRLQRHPDLRPHAFPEPAVARSHGRAGREDRPTTAGGITAEAREAKPGSQASESSRPLAKGWTPIGRRSRAADQCRHQDLRAVHRPSASRRSISISQIPKKGDQRQMEAWQRIGTYAAGLALDSAGIKGHAGNSRPHRHDRRRRRRRARPRGRWRHPDRRPKGEVRPHSSTNG